MGTVSPSNLSLLRDFLWSRPTQQNYLQPLKTKFLFKEVHESQIYQELRNLNRKNDIGLDNFPPDLLKDAASVIAKPLTFSINLSLGSGTLRLNGKSSLSPVFRPANTSTHLNCKRNITDKER